VVLDWRARHQRLLRTYRTPGHPVDDNDYQVPFHFTGEVAKLTFKLGPEQITEEDRKVMHKYVISLVRAKD
jgi:hypothetical protein